MTSESYSDASYNNWILALKAYYPQYTDLYAEIQGLYREGLSSKAVLLLIYISGASIVSIAHSSRPPSRS